MRFVARGRVVTVGSDVPPWTTVLDYVRLHLRRTGTKEGCAEGDCGACMAVLAEERDGRLHYRAVNTCILTLGQIDGCELITVDDLRGPDGGLHPVQDAMVRHHGSQCGFCTPGFVMSLFALYHSDTPADDDTLRDALAGNLCRCTGYRPILDAAKEALGASPRHDHFSARASERLAQLRSLRREHALDFEGTDPLGHGRFLAPRSLAELDDIMARCGDAAPWLLAGGTDLGLRLTKGGERPGLVIHLGQIAELRRIDQSDSEITFGAAVTYSDALPLLGAMHPALDAMLRRLASPPIRNSATLGGNIANGSPIGDGMPALIALGARLVLRSRSGQRDMALEDFYLAYRKTALQPHEYVERIIVPRLQPSHRYSVHKLSKRLDQDISAVLAAFRVTLKAGRISEVRLAFGGMAAIPARARQAEAALEGQPVNEAPIELAAEALAADFAPLSDMRASADYRRLAAANLLRRYLLALREGIAA